MRTSRWLAILISALIATTAPAAETAPTEGQAQSRIRLDLQPAAFDLALDGVTVAYSKGDPLFVLLYSDAADIWQARSWRMVAPSDAKVTRKGNNIRYAVESFEGLPIHLQARAAVDEATNEITWSMDVENKAPGTVVGVIGPCLRNVQDRPDSFLAVPNRAGHRIDDPWTALAGAVQHLEYPVPVSMQYLAYSGNDGGVAVHMFDKEMAYKLFDQIAPLFADRPGGYTRIVRLSGRRVGDDAQMALFELVEQPASEEKTSDKSKADRKS